LKSGEKETSGRLAEAPQDAAEGPVAGEPGEPREADERLDKALEDLKGGEVRDLEGLEPGDMRREFEVGRGARGPATRGGFLSNEERMPGFGFAMPASGKKGYLSRTKDRRYSGLSGPTHWFDGLFPHLPPAIKPTAAP